MRYASSPWSKKFLVDEVFKSLHVEILCVLNEVFAGPANFEIIQFNKKVLNKLFLFNDSLRDENRFRSLGTPLKFRK